MKNLRSAFTLVELLVTIAVATFLMSLVLIMVPGVKKRAQQAASLNNLRQIGMALRLYANDHDYALPQRVQAGERWPALLLNYLDDNAKPYAEPGSPRNYLALGEDPRSNTYNYTSYVINGFNDLGTWEDEGRLVKMMAIEQPSKTILMAVQEDKPNNFYLDLALGEQVSLLKIERYDGGSNYLFADGSSRFLKKTDYDHRMWLADKSYQIP